MAGERTFVVKILGNADGAITAFKKLAREGQESFEKVQSIGSKLGAAFDFVKKGAFIAVGALTAVAGAAIAAASAAAADQQSQANLEAQLIRSTGATQAQVDATEAFVEQAMMATGIADDELRPAFGNLARATNDLSKSQELFTLALDISAATGRDLSSVTLALGRAANGQIGALTRLGIPIDENAKKSKDFSSVLGTLQDQFGGASAKAADTFSGRLKILRTSFGEVVEEVGYALLPAFEKIVEFLQKRIVPALKAAVDGFKEKGLTGALKYFLAALGPAGIKIIDTFEAITIGVVTLGGQVQKLAAAIALAGVVLNPKGAWDAYNKIINLSANTAAAAEIKFDKLRAQIAYTASSLNLSGNKVSQFTDVTDRVGNKVLPKVIEETDEWNESLEDLKNQSGGANKTLDTAKEKLDKYTDALKSSTSAQKSLTNAQKASKDAQSGLDKANTDLTSAQENFNRAVAGYGADSVQAKAAQRELAKAQRNVEQAGYRVEESVFAVRDAELKLAELRKDPTTSAQAIREAEINLAQAKLAVAEASDSEFEATNGLAKAQFELNETVNGAIAGSQTYEELLKVLDDAKKNQEEASERVKEATERETEAFENLAEAIKKVADAAALLPNANLAVPTLPTVPTPTGVSGPPPGQGSGGGTQINITTGIGTNGIEAGRQIVEVLQQYSRIGGNNFLEFAVA